MLDAFVLLAGLDDKEDGRWRVDGGKKSLVSNRLEGGQTCCTVWRFLGDRERQETRNSKTGDGKWEKKTSSSQGRMM